MRRHLSEEEIALFFQQQNKIILKFLSQRLESCNFLGVQAFKNKDFTSESWGRTILWISYYELVIWLYWFLTPPFNSINDVYHLAGWLWAWWLGISRNNSTDISKIRPLGINSSTCPRGTKSRSADNSGLLPCSWWRKPDASATAVFSHWNNPRGLLLAFYKLKQSLK